MWACILSAELVLKLHDKYGHTKEFSLHDSVDIEMFGLHELILYVFEDYISMLLCIHSEDIGMFGLHELILCEFEDYLSL